MEQLIEHYKEQIDQIAGAIISVEQTLKQYPLGLDGFQLRLSILEARAELYQEMINLAEAFIKLTNK